MRTPVLNVALLLSLTMGTAGCLYQLPERQQATVYRQSLDVASLHRIDNRGIECVCRGANDSICIAGADFRIYNTRPWVLARLLKAEEGRIYAATANPEGTLLAIATFGGVVSLWDISSAKCVKKLTDPTSSLFSLQFSPNGKLLVGGGFEGMVYVWELAQYRCRHQFQAHGEAVSSVTFTNDSHNILTGGYDGFVKAWSSDTGKEGRSVLAHSDGIVTHVECSPDGSVFASASNDQTVAIRDLTTWKVKHSILFPEPVFRFAFCPKEPILVAVGGSAHLSSPSTGFIQLVNWQQATRISRRLFSGNCFTSIAISSGGSSCIATSREGHAITWLLKP